MEGQFKGLHWDKTKCAALLFTPATVYAMDIVKSKDPTMYRQHQNLYPELSIVHDQKEDGSCASGYVIHKGMAS